MKDCRKWIGEPGLPEILADPAVRAVMAVDNVRPADIENLFEAVFKQRGGDSDTADRNREPEFPMDVN